MADSFCAFHARYQHLFVTKTRSVIEQSLNYLSGLTQAVCKNVERMIEVVPNTEYQALQHFASKSPWDHRMVMDQVALDSDRHLGGTPDSGLIIDETGIPKKGKKSVGVARQCVITSYSIHYTKLYDGPKKQKTQPGSCRPCQGVRTIAGQHRQTSCPLWGCRFRQ